MSAPGESEAEIQNAILATCGHDPDVTLWRNNTGQAQEDGFTRAHLERLLSLMTAQRHGDVLALIRDLLKTKARYVRYGLCEGSSDIIGMVHTRVLGGASFGILLALEVKAAKGRVSEAQQRFLDHVNRMGGVGRVVRSVADAKQAIQEARAL